MTCGLPVLKSQPLVPLYVATSYSYCRHWRTRADVAVLADCTFERSDQFSFSLSHDWLLIWIARTSPWTGNVQWPWSTYYSVYVRTKTRDDNESQGNFCFFFSAAHLPPRTINHINSPHVSTIISFFSSRSWSRLQNSRLRILNTVLGRGHSSILIKRTAVIAVF